MIPTRPERSTAPPQLADDALELLRALLRIDTTNPPGNERPAAERCAAMLREAGLEPEFLEAEPLRTNLVCRLAGTGELPPLMLTAHLDVVPAGDGWTHPPFAGEEHDGFLWGRGALDMKNHAAASVAVICALAKAERKLKRDLLLVLVADEEAGCGVGSDWLVKTHPEKVKAEYAIGEIGGFTLHMEGRRFYPIQVAQKGVLWLKATARGEMGHGSMPREQSAVGRLAEAVAKVASTKLPFHPPKATRQFLEVVRRTQGPAKRLVLGALLNPRLAPALLKRLPDRGLARTFAAILANTVTPTILRAGEKINQIPATAEAELDGRTLPGPDGAKLLDELRAIIGPEIELTVTKEIPALEVSTETPLFWALEAAIRRADPEGIPVPYMIPGFTDAFAFARNGTTYYGFAPLALPKELKFSELFHNVDERVPVDGFRWGVEVLWDAVTTFCA